MDPVDRTIASTLALAGPRPGLAEELLATLRHLAVFPVLDVASRRRLGGRWVLASTLAGFGMGVAGLTFYELSRRRKAAV
jgi:hypothetical protein